MLQCKAHRLSQHTSLSHQLLQLPAAAAEGMPGAEGFSAQAGVTGSKWALQELQKRREVATADRLVGAGRKQIYSSCLEKY
jgi:hypothetical protein